MTRIPLKYQQDVLQWAMPRDRIGLFLQMRLGKTFIVIRWAITKLEHGEDVLVVSPRDVIDTWHRELKIEGVTATECLGGKAKPKRGWNITSYDSLRRNARLQSHRWTCVILDESTCIRNVKAKITQVCLRSFQSVRMKAVLSGKPAPESLCEYWPQLAFLNGSFLGHRNFYTWRKEYFDTDVMGWRWTPQVGTEGEISREVEKYAYTLTRRMAGIAIKEVRQSRNIEMPIKVRKVYDKAERTFEIRGEETKWKLTLRQWLSKLAGGTHPLVKSTHKLDCLMTLLTTELKGEPVVIWFVFNSELETVQHAMRRNGFSFRVLRGSVSSDDRSRAEKDFQTGKADYLLCQVKCSKFGRNLSRASTTIFFSLPWDLLSYEQARDRVFHPEKRETILTLSLITKGSIDEDVRLALTQKVNNTNSFRSLVTENFKRRLAKIGYGDS